MQDVIVPEVAKANIERAKALLPAPVVQQVNSLFDALFDVKDGRQYAEAIYAIIQAYPEFPVQFTNALALIRHPGKGYLELLKSFLFVQLLRSRAGAVARAANDVIKRANDVTHGLK